MKLQISSLIKENMVFDALVSVFQPVLLKKQECDTVFLFGECCLKITKRQNQVKESVSR